MTSRSPKASEAVRARFGERRPHRLAAGDPVLARILGRRTHRRYSPDPVPADRVNVIGRITGDPTVLRRVMEAPRIRVERV